MPNFDIELDRTNTNSYKWDQREKIFGRPDVIPMWVADSDFASPEGVISALRARVDHGVYGYTLLPDSYFEALCAWLTRRFKWTVDPQWVLCTPGIVPALYCAVQAFCKPGDRVVVQPPVYPPFFSAIRDSGCEVRTNELLNEDGRYRMNFEELESEFKAGAKMMLLCSPHNPVGRVWRREELEVLKDLVLRYQVLVVSDEIHGDIVFPPAEHLPFTTLDPELEPYVITCVSPSKSFNLAGLHFGSVIIPDAALRRVFRKAFDRTGVSPITCFSAVAAEAAYRSGGEWLAEFVRYVDSNIRFAATFIEREFEQLRCSPPEGTYLLWIDFRKLGLDDQELRSFIAGSARLGLNHGPVFGPGGSGFQRMNLACPRKTVENALAQLAEALSSRSWAAAATL